MNSQAGKWALNIWNLKNQKFEIETLFGYNSAQCITICNSKRLITSGLTLTFGLLVLFLYPLNIYFFKIYH